MDRFDIPSPRFSTCSHPFAQYVKTSVPSPVRTEPDMARFDISSSRAIQVYIHITQNLKSSVPTPIRIEPDMARFDFTSPRIHTGLHKLEIFELLGSIISSHRTGYGSI